MAARRFASPLAATNNGRPATLSAAPVRPRALIARDGPRRAACGLAADEGLILCSTPSPIVSPIRPLAVAATDNRCVLRSAPAQRRAARDGRVERRRRGMGAGSRGWLPLAHIQ